MPSATLSNYQPITGSASTTKCSRHSCPRSDRIVLGDGLTSGHPQLDGISPGCGACERLVIGAESAVPIWRRCARRQLLAARIQLVVQVHPRAPRPAIVSQQIGNQEASITSSLLFPGQGAVLRLFRVRRRGYLPRQVIPARQCRVVGRNPFPAAVGAVSTSRWKQLNGRTPGTCTASTWTALTNYGHVVGNWFGDQRVFGDAALAVAAAMVRLGWDAPFGGLVQLQYRNAAERVVLRRLTTNAITMSHWPTRGPCMASSSAAQVETGAMFSVVIFPGSPDSSVTTRADRWPTRSSRNARRGG